MKRLIAPIALFTAIITFCALCTWRVSRICQEAEWMLAQAEEQSSAGNWDAAQALTDRSLRLWQRHEGFLGLALRHTESDDISMFYPPLAEACRHRDLEDFSQRSQELRAALEALWRMEVPYYYNVL